MNVSRRYTGPDQMVLCTICRETLPVDRFALRHDTRIPSVRSNCRKCLTYAQTSRNRENRTDAQAYWWARQIAKYGLTPETWAEMFASQGECCAICGIDANGKKRFHVEHDHDTGQVRGILCTTCNTGIGSLKDDPDLVLKAYLYLSQAVQEGNSLDHDTPVSVNPSRDSSQGNTEVTDASGTVETERGAPAQP